MKVVNVKNVAIGEGMTKICVPLVAPTDYDVDYQLRIIAKSEPDMVEFRAVPYYIYIPNKGRGWLHGGNTQPVSRPSY